MVCIEILVSMCMRNNLGDFKAILNIISLFQCAPTILLSVGERGAVHAVSIQPTQGAPAALDLLILGENELVPRDKDLCNTFVT